jgi:formamidopyrimidine-DNA glycosylase
VPELPEVETTLRGIAPHVVNKAIAKVVVRHWQLRWPVSPELPRLLTGRTVLALKRRGKYLIFTLTHGSLIVHLGMSGSLRVVESNTAAGKHDHLDLIFATGKSTSGKKRPAGKSLRFTDPRRFGAVLWTSDPVENYPLLQRLGPEPLTGEFNPEYLFQQSRERRVGVKLFIMDSKIVVGVGNIYANEALFLAGIRPGKAAGRLSRVESGRLVEAIKNVLSKAIAAGGTTLRDFLGGDGKPGYFKQQLFVYGRSGEACLICRTPLKMKRLGQRATVYCSHCQH